MKGIDEMEQLVEMEKLATQASTGPWKVDYHVPEKYHMGHIVTAKDAYSGYRYRIEVDHREDLSSPMVDAEFIAASREFVPWAIARMRKLEALLCAVELETVPGEFPAIDRSVAELERE